MFSGVPMALWFELGPKSQKNLHIKITATMQTPCVLEKDLNDLALGC